MQPGWRRPVWSVFDSAIVLNRSRLTRQLSASSPTRISICFRCQFRLQRRHFADDQKQKPPSASTETPIASNLNNGGYSLSAMSPELPSDSESRRSAASKRLSHLMDNMQSNLVHASQRLNDLTGYSGIEELKASIGAQEKQVDQCQEAVRRARQTYKTTVADRAASQREVTTLLARKDTWTPTDLERFTSLYRSDHGNEQAVQEATLKLAEAERIAEQAASKLSTSILRRYHEEQIWSDKIRRMSTWGTWGLMGVNVLIFLVFQFGFEPWRRRRLVKGFEEKVHEALERAKNKQADPSNGFEDGGAETDLGTARVDGLVATGEQELEVETDDTAADEQPACDALVAVILDNGNGADGNNARTTSSPLDENRLHILSRLGVWKISMLDLFGDRRVLLKQQDVTIIALEGAATGAALASLFMMFIFRPS